MIGSRFPVAQLFVADRADRIARGGDVAIEEIKATPIILLTGVESAEAQIFNGYSLGAVDYLVTPIVPDLLTQGQR